MPKAPVLLGLWLLLCTLTPGHAQAPQARKKVVVIAGLPGSGKTTLSKSLAGAMKARRHTCGDVVRGWIRAHGLPYTPENDRRASQHFARTPGEIARQLSKKIDRSRKPIHIVDGVRSPADLKVLDERYDVRVVALKLPRKIRFERMLARGRFAGEDASYLTRRDRREIGLGLLHVLRKPFVRIETKGPISRVPERARGLSELLQNSW
jgi:dephospho-CoA kinase